MNNQELDRLFRQKFEELREEPSSRAWQQLEEQLQKKKKNRFWGYFSGIAASLLMLFGVWAAMEFSQKIPPAEQIVQKPQAEESLKPTQADKEMVQEALPVEQKGTTSSAKIEEIEEKEIIAKKEEKKSLAQSTKKSPARKDVNKTIVKKAPESAEPKNLASAESLIAEETAPSVSPESARKESIIIRYNAADAPEQVLAQKSEIDKTDVKPGKEKELSARKVIGFLKKVKSSGAGNLAELREAKDELLSLRLGKAN